MGSGRMIASAILRIGALTGCQHQTNPCSKILVTIIMPATKESRRRRACNKFIGRCNGMI